ncbi:hypothetical protein BMETH_323012021257, partial [methanotrophic bacterial endosymbiont of Bathymodiolus sp.]
KDKVNKPVFLTSSNDKERANIIKVINQLIKINEIELIAGTISIDPKTAKLKAFDRDGVEIYKSPEM